MATKKKKLPSNLRQLEEEALAERPKVRKRRATGVQERKTKGSVKKTGRSTIGKEVRKGKRKPPPVPEGKTLEEIKEMDPDDDEFKHPQGMKRKYKGADTRKMSWKEAANADKQKRQNERRAKVRRHEAVVVKAIQDTGIVRGNVDNPTENALVADHVLDLDDWDRDELLRGYRRMRNGRFGAPPKYIPREVQQECFKRLIKIGDKDLKRAYLDVIKGLIDFARGYTVDEKGEVSEVDVSDKVRMQAMKEVMDRVVGKVPEHFRVEQDAPYQDFLADSLEPIGLVERTVTNIEGHRTTVELEADEQLELESGDVVEAEVV